jgi:two-component system sensor kinase FixL
MPHASYRKMYERTSSLAKIGVWECDLATEELTWTDAVYDLFDLPRQSVVSRSATLACYDPDSRRKMERLRAQAIASGTSFGLDVAVRTALGNRRWIRLTGDVEQEGGRSVRIFGTKQDITLEKNAQLEVQALQNELIHLSRAGAMNAMGSTLAHELNQPLTAIAGYAATMRRMMAAEDIDRDVARGVMEGIEECALRAGDIIRSVREMTGRGKIERRPFDLETVVREACAIALSGPFADVAVSYDFGEAMRVIGDPIAIQQVVINLVRNACEALAFVDHRAIELSASRADGLAEVVVSDTGPGIADEIAASLFESFVSTKAEGMGVGLSISRTIVEAHGGKIRAGNRLQGGASFRFTLPAPGASARVESLEWSSISRPVVSRRGHG